MSQHGDHTAIHPRFDAGGYHEHRPPRPTTFDRPQATLAPRHPEPTRAPIEPRSVRSALLTGLSALFFLIGGVVTYFAPALTAPSYIAGSCVMLVNVATCSDLRMQLARRSTGRPHRRR